MLNSKSFLSIDFGAGSLKIAEFEINEAGSLRLRNYGLKPLGLEGAQESKRETAIQRALQELLAEKGFVARNINLCAPGFHVFSKFVRLPPVDSAKVTQIIQYEAQQNVPFPLEEVVWDYQILGTTPTGELEVLLVAIKADIVEGLFRVAESRGLRLQLVDVSAAALCNAFRFNYGDLEGCTMVLDIGAKTSNLLLFEKGKFYSRSINIGANSITQDFATEGKLKFDEAEQVKIADGFVSLGGAYEEPDNPRQAQISKIARQVMTRLHIQVNQTIQFYRGQQGGSAPQRLFLCGGASVMPYTAQFFAEKLNVPVDYFNPLRNIQIDPSINLEDLARVAHSFGEVVGVALRNLAQCPVELNLMPKSSLHKQQLSQKRPYFIAALCSLVLVALAIGWFSYKMTADKQAALTNVTTKLTPLQAKQKQLTDVTGQITAAKKQIQEFGALVETKLYWVDLLTELRRIFRETEEKTRRPGVDTGIWIEEFKMASRASGVEASAQAGGESGGEAQTVSKDFSDRMFKRYGAAYLKSIMRTPSALAGSGGETAAPTNDFSVINLTCRGVDLSQISPQANLDFLNVLKEGLKASSFFVASNTAVTGDLQPTPPTFKVGVTLKLKNPVKQ
jgi:type IV pilus assembly protein PilM